MSKGWCGLARLCSLEGENPAWKDIAVSPVASLGAREAIHGFKRRQQGNGPETEKWVIEPRNFSKTGRLTVSHYRKTILYRTTRRGR